MTSETKPGKLCGCGILWTKLPPKTPWIDEGVVIGSFFNCTCNSTLFVAQNRVKKLPQDKQVYDAILKATGSVKDTEEAMAYLAKMEEP